MTFRDRIRSTRKRTWIITGAIAILCIAGGTAYWFGVAVPASEARSQEPVTARAAASLETLQKTVDASGTVSASINESVSFEASGTVTALEVAEGSAVSEGDVLATLDTLTMESALLDARATLAQAEADLASSTDSSDGSAAAVAQISANTSAVSVAQQTVDDAVAALDSTTLVAPVSGVVTSIGVDVGDRVESGSSSAAPEGSTGGTTADTPTSASTTSSTSTAAFTIVGEDSWSVSITVGETDVALIAVDDQVELSLADGTAFFGTVAEVGLVPSTDSGAAAYPVTVAVTGDAAGLHDGIDADASIVYERRTDVLTVPAAAVSTDRDISTVTLVDAQGAETEATVTIGETSGDLVEITEGLSEGDEVLVTVFTPDGGTQSGGGGDGQFPDGGMTPPEGFTPPDGAELPSGDFPGGDFPAGGFTPGSEG